MIKIPAVITDAKIFATNDIFLMVEIQNRGYMVNVPMKYLYYVRDEAEIVAALEAEWIYEEETGLKAILRCDRLSEDCYELEIVKGHEMEGDRHELLYLQRLLSLEQTVEWRRNR